MSAEPSISPDEWVYWRCNEGACVFCRQYDSMMFPVDQMVAMPPEGCRCEGRCRSEYVSLEENWPPPRWPQWTCLDDACPACRERDGVICEPGAEKPMPPEDCTCEGGCRSIYTFTPPPEDFDASCEVSEEKRVRRAKLYAIAALTVLAVVIVVILGIILR